MKSLVIDSHKGSEGEIPTNLHWTNAKQVADCLGADLIWSYPSVNDKIKEGYDKIIFVHASPYSYVDQAWVDKSPDADLYYVTNEYNLGEPRVLWKPAKAGRHYTVIANHEPDISKIVKKYTKDWKKVNLNALSYQPRWTNTEELFNTERQGIVYYGSFRKGRIPSYRKYLNSNSVLISTHPKNCFKYMQVCPQQSLLTSRINWNERGLFDFESSLYLEDEITHTSYNYLANRFYEALNYGCPTLFDKGCWNTIHTSGYPIPNDLIVDSLCELIQARPYVPSLWHERAASEKYSALQKIREIIHE